MEYFQISKYKLQQLLEDGIMPPPIKEPNRHAFWLDRHLRTAEKRINERDNPPVELIPTGRKERKIRKSVSNQIRAYHGLPLIP